MKKQRSVYLDSIIITALVFLFTWGWTKPGLPHEDFPGTVTWLWYIKDSFLNLHRLPIWSPQWFNGGSLVLIMNNFLSFLILLPLSFFLDLILATKIVLVTFHCLAGLSMYTFINYFLRDREAALFAGIVYALHPLYLMETARHGHVAVSMFYALVPLSFYLYYRALEKPTLKRSLLTGVFFFLLVWMEVEKAFSLLPFFPLVLFFQPFITLPEPEKDKGKCSQRKKAKTSSRKKKVSEGYNFKEKLSSVVLIKNLKITLIIILTALGLAAFFVVPSLFERNHHYLFSDKVIESGIRQFSIQNLLYLIDWDGFFLRRVAHILSPSLTMFRGMLYLGIVPLMLTVYAAIFSFTGKRKLANKNFFLFLSILFLGSVWLSFGAYSIGGSSAQIIKQLFTSDRFLDENTLLLFILVGLLMALIITVFRKKNMFLQWICEHKILTLGLLFFILTGLFLKGYLFLRTLVPVYKHIRSPLSFYVILVPFTMAALSAFSIQTLKRNNKYGFDCVTAFILIIGLLIIDFFPYRRYFSQQISPHGIRDLKATFSYLKRDEDIFRTLGIESYHPLTDMGVLFSHKPAAWAWLNWDSPKRSGRYIFDNLYPCLWTPSRRKEAAILAGLANIKYVVDDRAVEPPFAAGGEFKEIEGGNFFTIYENQDWKDYVQTYNQSVFYVGDEEDEVFKLITGLSKKNIGVVNVEDNFLKNTPPDFLKQFNYVVGEKDKKTDRHLLSLKEALDLPAKPCEDEPLINWERVSPEKVKVEVKTNYPLLLTISESFYPGWHVYVDGEEKELLAANYAFQGVLVDRGWHEIVFQYKKPVYFFVGYGISIMTLLTIAVLLIRFPKQPDGEQL